MLVKRIIIIIIVFLLLSSCNSSRKVDNYNNFKKQVNESYFSKYPIHDKKSINECIIQSIYYIDGFEYTGIAGIYNLFEYDSLEVLHILKDIKKNNYQSFRLNEISSLGQIEDNKYCYKFVNSTLAIPNLLDDLCDNNFCFKEDEIICFIKETGHGDIINQELNRISSEKMEQNNYTIGVFYIEERDILVFWFIITN